MSLRHLSFFCGVTLVGIILPMWCNSCWQEVFFESLGKVRKGKDWEEVCDWTWIRDWMATCDKCDWPYYISYSGESFGRKELFKVYFTTVCGNEYDILTFACENFQSAPLDVKAFPSCCRGLALRGAFDLSHVKINDSVEHLAWTFECNEDGLWNFADSLPQFSVSSKLRRIELDPYCCWGMKGEYAQVLDLKRFSCLDRLEEANISMDGIIANLPLFIRGKSLRNARIAMYFDRTWYQCEDEKYSESFRSIFADFENIYAANESSLNSEVGRSISIDVNDSTFDSFRMIDLAAFEFINLNIALSELRHLTLRPILEGQIMGRNIRQRKCIRIQSKNCIIDDLEYVSDFSSVEMIDVQMEFDLGHVR